MSAFIVFAIIGYFMFCNNSPSAKEIADEIEWQRQHNEKLRQLEELR